MNATLANIRGALEEYNARLIAELRIYREALLAIGASNPARLVEYAKKYDLGISSPGIIARNALQMADDIDES